MPETFNDTVNRILRDHEGYTGDGQGGVGDLPIGDMSTARKPISKRDLREAFSAVEDIAIPVSSVADVIASTTLTDGYFLSTRGYTTAGDGGAGTYEVMTSDAYADLTDTPATPDGYIDHEMDNGMVARLLHSGTIAAEQAGAVSGVEASAQIQAAWDALILWQAAQDGDDTPFTITHGSQVTIQNKVLFNNDSSMAYRANILFSGARWDAVSGGDLTDTNPMWTIRASNSKIEMPKMFGGKFAACADFFGVTASSIKGNECRHFKGIGYRVRGSAGSAELSHPVITEYTQADDEFEDRSNWSAKGMSVETGDMTIWGLTTLYSDTPLYIGTDVAQLYLIRPHIVNDSGGQATIPVDPVLIENRSTNQVRVIAGYFDNGIVLDYGHTLNCLSCHYTANSKATLTHPYHRIIATAADQDVGDLADLIIADYGGKASVGFVDDGANTWAGDWASLADEYTRMSERDGDVAYNRTQFNIYPEATQEVEFNFVPGGGFQYEWQSAGEKIIARYLPQNDVVQYEMVHDGAEFFEIGPNSPILTGTGSPEGSVTAPTGAIYRNRNGGTGTTLYMKEVGTGNTGWAPTGSQMYFATRAAFVTRVDDGAVYEAGAAVCAGGIWYVKVASSTVISDLDDWEPLGDVYPDHFAENTTPGTTDMATAIVAAAHINGSSGSSSSTGHTVHFKAERYAHSAIVITRDAVRLKGAGKQATRMQYLSATGDGITMGNDSSKMFRPGIEDMSIGMAAGVEKTSGAHIKIVRGRGGSLTGLEIDDFFDGVTLEGSDRCMVYDVTGTNLNRTLKAGKFFSQLYHSAAGEKCTDNKFTLIRTAASSIEGDAAMYIESADGCHIVGAELNNYDYAIHIHTDTGNPSIGGLMCSNTYFDESNVNNMRVDGDGTFQNAKFTGCYFRAAAEDSIHVTADPTIDGVLFTGSSCETAEEMAVNWIAQGSTGVMFSGCLFDDNLRDDTTTTEVYYNGDNLTMTGCNFKGGWASGVCITLGANSTDCMVVPNNFLATTNGTTITDNGSGNTAS